LVLSRRRDAEQAIAISLLVLGVACGARLAFAASVCLKPSGVLCVRNAGS
jgi:hypothetical protein